MHILWLVKVVILVIFLCAVATYLKWIQLSIPGIGDGGGSEQEQKVNLGTPLILWWTPHLANYHMERLCGSHSCIFSARHEKLHDAQVLLFYGSDVNKGDFPLPRQKHQLWGLLHEESPKNIPFIQYDTMLQHFNFTSTFSRYSDLPITTEALKNLGELTSSQYVVPVEEKTRLQSIQGLAPIVFVQSICDTMSGRDVYVQELMRHIQVDSCGKCLHNKDMPANLTDNYLNQLDSPDFYRFLAKYKFILSYENAVCNDYITEKFWRPLIVGSVPIYFGAPTIRDWQPTNKSVIYIDDFPSPKLLADFIMRLDANDTAYNSYLDHKNAVSASKRITNTLLSSAMARQAASKLHFFDRFECYACQQLFEMPRKTLRRATHTHYDCPEALVYPPMDDNGVKLLHQNDWEMVPALGKCQAMILDSLLSRNRNFTEKQFNDLLEKSVRDEICDF